MANIKSAIKRAQLAKERNLRNASAKSALKTAIKRFDEALTGNIDVETTTNNYKTAIKKLDKAVGKGLLHKNAAARKKSRLTKKMNGFTTNIS